MPQLEVKGPTIRRLGTELAVAVDFPFFEAIGGSSDAPFYDLKVGDIVWLVPKISRSYDLVEHHWEVLSLEASCDKLLSAAKVNRHELEKLPRTKLQRLDPNAEA